MNQTSLLVLIQIFRTKHWTGAVPTRPDISYEYIYQPLGLPAAELSKPEVQQQDYAFLDALVAPADEKVGNLATPYLACS